MTNEYKDILTLLDTISVAHGSNYIIKATRITEDSYTNL